MEQVIKVESVNPKQTASFISRLFFGWTFPMFKKGTKNDLQVKDLYQSLEVDQSQMLGNKLEQNWDQELLRSKLEENYTPSFFKAIFKTFIANYALCGMKTSVMEIIRTCQPILLGQLILYFSDSNSMSKSNATWIAVGLIGMSFINVFVGHHSVYHRLSIGMRVRVACCSLIYRKLLRLSKSSMGQTAAGQVVNLLSNDVSRFDLLFIYLNYLWIMPLQLCAITYLLWDNVGLAAVPGVGAMFLLTIPVQGYFGKLTSRIRLKVATRTDDRVLIMSEIISGIQVIKMYAWEKPFNAVVKFARWREMKKLSQSAYLRGLYVSIMVFTERTTLFLSVVTFSLMGNVISPQKVFAMAQLYNILQASMAIMYPQAITMGAETLVSIKRLQKFLMLDEKTSGHIMLKRSAEPADGITLIDVNASWVPGVPTLQNISIRIKPGQLCAIVGPVGSAKSSLLQMLLMELPSEGSMRMGGKVSYCSQEPWLFAGTVRNNILFGLPYEKNKYLEVVRVCALVKDFEQFPRGDLTYIGDRGSSLSGGQKARINLARAVYRDADVYLLDDPLSAVDTHVAKHLFQECIVNRLNKYTRVLVTHQIQFLKEADHVVVLNNGHVEAQGTYEELLASNLTFTNYLPKEVVVDENTEKELMKAEEMKELVRTMSIRNSKRLSNTSKMSYGVSEPSVDDLSLEEIVDHGEEKMETGALSFDIYKQYFKAGGGLCKRLTIFIIIVLSQTCCNCSDFWLSIWTNQEAIRNTLLDHSEDVVEYNSSDTGSTFDIIDDEVKRNETLDSLFSTEFSIYVYTGLIIATIIIVLVRSMLLFNMCMCASRRLHNKMFASLIQAPMRFFDTNPPGRVLNRFSKDIGTMDELLPRLLVDTIQIMLVTIGIVVIVSIVNPYMVIAAVIAAAMFYKIRDLYLLTAQDLRRIEGVTRSPVFSHISASLNGLTTIRSCGAEEALRELFDDHQNLHTSAWHMTIACSGALGFWLDLLCVAFIACEIICFLYMSGENFNGSSVGLAVSQSFILAGMLQYGIKQSTEMVSQMTSVERVLQYTKLDKEGPFETPEGKNPPRNWPSGGGVEFSNVYLRYDKNEPPVLKNLNIEIKPGEKIGIVGRTGAGKSSLISSLFRLSPIEGDIVIDNVDTKELGLTDLRSRISIIPQQPILFSASLRNNLDPFNQSDDLTIWDALEQVQLKSAVTTLDFAVNEGGSNFSLGQRQLICLARAILRKNKILVLDEATANVDLQTDSLIQTTIRQKFSTCTVLTVAHRLQTIIDSDRVLVMDAGRAVEYDHPYVLLQNADGVFYKMVAETGSTMAQELHDKAAEHYLNKSDKITKL